MSLKKFISRGSLIAAAALFAFPVSQSFAAGGGSREMHRIGILGGVGNAPLPSLYGVNAAMNISSFMRIMGGVGFTKGTIGGINIDATTIGGELDFLVPTWNFSPLVGIGYATLSSSFSGTGQLAALGSLSAGGNTTFVSFGLDWQTNYGLTIGLTYKISLAYSDIQLPGLHLGWFF